MSEPRTSPWELAGVLRYAIQEHARAERLAAENAELRAERTQRIATAYDNMAPGEAIVSAALWETMKADARRWWAWKHRMTTSSFEPDSYDYDAEADRLAEKEVRDG